jgi:glycosyltransferase involved in cell wall biosynthesis
MSVYNAEEYLDHAIRSILEQSFGDFEFIIINDGSKDRSLEIIKGFDDPRIRLIDRENKGLTASLNEAIELARGEYLARQDADDFSHPERFEREVARLEADPGLGLIGSNYVVVDEQDDSVGQTNVFTHPDDLKVVEALSNQFGHGSIMMRTEVVKQVGPYDPAVGIVEDYDLFVRISHVAQIANIKEPLYYWRRNPVGVSLSNQDRQMKNFYAVRDREWERIKAHRNEYRIFTSFHPDSLRYFDRKAAVFRDLAYLHRRDGHVLKALGLLLLATALSPWRKRNMRFLSTLWSDERFSRVWEYEYI